VELYLIRHGEPEWVLEGLNVVDPPLTERGHRQAKAMAESIAAVHFDEVLVSPLVRARQTAAPLLAAQGREELIDPWLEEIRSPLWHGTPREKADAAYREERAKKASDRWSGLDGGEAVRDFVDRIHLGASLFLAEHGITRLDHELPVWQIERPEQRLCLVAHAGVDSVIICHLLGLQPTPWEWERFVLGHSSISRIEAMQLGDGWTFCLTALGIVDHLDVEDRTR